MRTSLVVANWKMNHTIEETLKFLTRFKKGFVNTSSVEIVICAPYTSLYSLSVAISDIVGIKLGAQNCHWEERGAYTGEVSPQFLRELNCSYVIVGHSERRLLFSETDEMVGKKVGAVLNHGMNPVLCIGETRKNRDEGKTWEVVSEQLAKGLLRVDSLSMEKVVIAYEPVWAIGTGLSATPPMAQEVHKLIRGWIKEEKGEGCAMTSRLLYGGSVSAQNFSSFIKQPDIDGALVGGASLEVDSFRQIVHDARVL